MTHAEFLNKMVALERAINDLAKSLEDECFEHMELETNTWLQLHSAAELAKGMTYTKLAISYTRDAILGTE